MGCSGRRVGRHRPEGETNTGNRSWTDAKHADQQGETKTSVICAGTAPRGQRSQQHNYEREISQRINLETDSAQNYTATFLFHASSGFVRECTLREGTREERSNSSVSDLVPPSGENGLRSRIATPPRVAGRQTRATATNHSTGAAAVRERARFRQPALMVASVGHRRYRDNSLDSSHAASHHSGSSSSLATIKPLINQLIINRAPASGAGRRTELAFSAKRSPGITFNIIGWVRTAKGLHRSNQPGEGLFAERVPV